MRKITRQEKVLGQIVFFGGIRTYISRICYENEKHEFVCLNIHEYWEDADPDATFSSSGWKYECRFRVNYEPSSHSGPPEEYDFFSLEVDETLKYQNQLELDKEILKMKVLLENSKV